MKNFSIKAFVALSLLQLSCADEAELETYHGMAVGLTDALVGTQLQGIEAALRSLAKDITSHKETVTPALVPFIDQVWDLVENMKDNVRNWSRVQQKQLNDAYWRFTNVTSPLINRPNCTTYNESHRDCRLDESALLIQWQNCKDNCSQQCALCPPLCEDGCDYPIRDPGLAGCAMPAGQTTSLTWMLTLVERFKALNASCNSSRTQCNNCERDCVNCNASCDVTWQLYVNKKAKCDLYQHDLEAYSCNETTPSCLAYLEDYNRSYWNWISINRSVAKEEVGFLAQFKGLLTVECLLAAFKSSIVNSTNLLAGINECNLYDFGAYVFMNSLYIQYWSFVPPLMPCVNYGNGCPVTPPGTPMFWLEFYDFMPNNTQLATCGAYCCHKAVYAVNDPAWFGATGWSVLQMRHAQTSRAQPNILSWAEDLSVV